MSRILIVMRHGQAEAGRAGVPDRERELTEVGREKARRVGEELARQGFTPQRALVSSATRTRQTFAQVRDSIDGISEKYVDALYGAGPEGVFDLLASVDDTVESVMLVGHNPTFSEVASYLGRSMFSLHPGDTVVFESDHATWAERRPGTWQVRAHIT